MKLSRLSFAASLCAALPFAQAASAQQQTEFSIEGESYSFTVPEGFCLPQGEEARRARVIASWDSQNHTPVDIQRCGSFGVSYTLIKSPRGFPPVRTTRSAFIAQVTNELNTENIQRGVQRGQDDVSRGSGGQVKVDAGDYGYSGADNACVYLSGNIAVTMANGAKGNARGATCVTLVGTRSMAIHSYDYDPNGASFAELRARSRAVATSIAKK